MLAALFGAKAKKNAVSVTGSHARINPGDMPSWCLVTGSLPSGVVHGVVGCLTLSGCLVSLCNV